MALFICVTQKFRWNHFCLYQRSKIFRKNYWWYLCRTGCETSSKVLHHLPTL